MTTKYPVNVTARAVVTRPDGSIVSTVCKDQDIALDNFTTIMAGIFTPQTPSAQHEVTVKDIANASRTLIIWAANNDFNTNTYGFQGNTSNNKTGVQIGVGSVSTAATRADYKLGTELARGYIQEPVTGGGVVTMVGVSINGSASAWTVREVGLFWYTNFKASSNPAIVMLFHDIIADTTVNAGETITVTYTFTFP